MRASILSFSSDRWTAPCSQSRDETASARRALRRKSGCPGGPCARSRIPLPAEHGAIFFPCNRVLQPELAESTRNDETRSVSQAGRSDHPAFLGHLRGKRWRSMVDVASTDLSREYGLPAGNQPRQIAPPAQDPCLAPTQARPACRSGLGQLGSPLSVPGDSVPGARKRSLGGHPVLLELDRDSSSLSWEGKGGAWTEALRLLTYLPTA